MPIQPGDRVEVERTFTQRDFDDFAQLSGDDNPIHVDPEFAKTTRFGRTLAHGMMLFSTLSAVISTRLPGPGALILDQQLMFPGPTYTDERLSVSVEVLEVHEDRATLKVAITKPDEPGVVCCQGETVVQMAPEAP